MYIPKIFEKLDKQEVLNFLKENPFGILVTQHNGLPLATHIPLELKESPDGKLLLIGHLAKKNEQWQSFDQNSEVLAIFQGANAYVSASWYSIEEVSTWNYTAIHVYGTIRTLKQEELMPMLEDLMAKYEADVENPIRMNTLSKATLNQVYGIVGFEITVTQIQPKYKLSQNRSKKDYENIINKLEAKPDSGAKGVADSMKKNAKDRIQ